MKLNTKNKGFTLIELLVVIAIIGLLSGIVLTSLQNTRVSARNSERIQTVDALQKAAEIYASSKAPYKLPTHTLPTGTNVAVGTNFCLGANTLVGSETTTGCTGPANGISPVLDGIFGPLLSKGIPRNTAIGVGTAGYWYKYRSAVSFNATPAAYPLPALTGGTVSACNATTCPEGAYLTWNMERGSIPSMAGASCGKGVVHTFNPAWKTYACVLRLGDRVTK